MRIATNLKRCSYPAVLQSIPSLSQRYAHLHYKRGTKMKLEGMIGVSLHIEASPVLPANGIPSWIEVTNVTLSQTTVEIFNTTPATNGNRFYRAVWVSP